ncbi:MAG: hypothetical protein HY303_00125 [Candidatus Wallbacteria bacterium]|nr:hypothetical protein [Candidatus Wallbacteria bacterium]
MKRLNIGLVTVIALGLLSGSAFAQTPAADASKAAPAAAEAAKPAADAKADAGAKKPGKKAKVRKAKKEKSATAKAATAPKKAKKAKKAKKSKAKAQAAATGGEGYTESTPAAAEATTSAPESTGSEDKYASIRKRANIPSSHAAVDREKLTPGMKKFMEKIDELRKLHGGSI